MHFLPTIGSHVVSLKMAQEDMDVSQLVASSSATVYDVCLLRLSSPHQSSCSGISAALLNLSRSLLRLSCFSLSISCSRNLHPQ